MNFPFFPYPGHRLLPPNYVAQHATVTQHPDWFQQHSRHWKNLRAQAHITGSTAYNAMGFRGFSHIRSHSREFIYKKGQAILDAELTCNMGLGMRLVVTYYLNFLCYTVYSRVSHC